LGCSGVGRDLARFVGLMFTVECLGDGSVVIKKFDRAHGEWVVVKRVESVDVAERLLEEWWLWLV